MVKQTPKKPTIFSFGPHPAVLMALCPVTTLGGVQGTIWTVRD